MTRTPDEIKTGLECCTGNLLDCESCPYSEIILCQQVLKDDALALIQQLESDKQQLEGLLTHMNQLRDAAAGRALKMEERVHQLEAQNAELSGKIGQLQAERDAAVKDIEFDGACEVCKHIEKDAGEPPCNNCFHVNKGKDSHFEWRGVKKEE